jgi:SAM-dependent methyltransferase
MAKDLFSNQASTYAAFRPGYPPALFEYILSFVSTRESAWDCATGNGQAASELAGYFQKVYATDISNEQIERAIKHPNIIYSVASAEGSGLSDSSADLIAVAQAYHWFNFNAFEKEVKRVAKSDAIIAIWCYTLPEADDRFINEQIIHFYSEVLDSYWDPERKLIEEEYKTVPFPYEELPAAKFETELSWTLHTLEGYLNSWSSVQRFKEKNDYNPVDSLIKELSQTLREDKPFKVRFPIFLRVGKVHFT